MLGKEGVPFPFKFFQFLLGLGLAQMSLQFDFVP